MPVIEPAIAASHQHHPQFPILSYKRKYKFYKYTESLRLSAQHPFLLAQIILENDAYLKK